MAKSRRCLPAPATASTFRPVVISLAILAVCWLSYIAFQGFIHQFDEAAK